MKSKKNPVFSICKFLITILALANLAALFLFEYKLPDFFHFKNSEEDQEVPVTISVSEVNSSDYTIVFNSDLLIFDGTSELDLLEGVSLISPDGQPADNEIFAHITTGASLDQKIVEYSADTESGSVCASRGLRLENYSGPSITLPGTLPEIDESQTNSIIDYMPDDGSFFANDGYGNDITRAVSVSHAYDEDNPTLIHYTFTVTNLFNDTVSVQADVSLGAAGPFITLKESEVTIARGSSFQPLVYVENAADADGNSLFDRINIEGTVDSNTPGTYILIFSVTTADGKSSPSKELKITVE